MRYLVGLFVVIACLWSLQSIAAEPQIKFQLRPVGVNNIEKSVVWNPTTQEATIRMGLLLSYIDPNLQNIPISFSTAKKVDMMPLQNPNGLEGCKEVSEWQLEYQPGLPDYLMYITLKGPKCDALAENLETYHTRFHFSGVAVPNSDPIDLDVEISR